MKVSAIRNSMLLTPSRAMDVSTTRFGSLFHSLRMCLSTIQRITSKTVWISGSNSFHHAPDLTHTAIGEQFSSSNRSAAIRSKEQHSFRDLLDAPQASLRHR